MFPAYSGSEAYRIEFFGDEVDRISEIDALTGEVKAQLGHVAIFPASHYVVPKEKMMAATENIDVYKRQDHRRRFPGLSGCGKPGSTDRQRELLCRLFSRKLSNKDTGGSPEGPV